MATHLQLAPGPNRSGAAVPSIKIILADDHATVRRNLRLLLEREEGMEVVAEAADLSAVMRHVPVHLPHVLVLDVRPHNGSTIDTIRRLREKVPDTEIIVVTMEESPAFAQQAIGAGASGFVLKDRADDELPVAIREVARGEKYVSPRVAAALAALRKGVRGDGLSQREVEVLRLIALGHTSAEIAQKLSLSRRTVETHRAQIHRELGVDTRAQLVSYALGRHLIG